MKDKTCGNCEHLNITDMCGLALAGCKKTGFIIPHESQLEFGKRGDATIIRFSRIPLECPLPDTLKSESPAPLKDWVKRTIKV